jgi:hypothetical protein
MAAPIITIGIRGKGLRLRMIITLLSMSKKVYEGVIKVNTKRSFLTPLPIKKWKRDEGNILSSSL